VDPKTSWPSKWDILVVKEDLLRCLAMMLTICDGHQIGLFTTISIHPTRTLSTSCTIQIYHVRCTLSEHLNIIMKSRNEKVFNIFPKLLQLNIMDYFK
jgi:hypothetical protein